MNIESIYRRGNLCLSDLIVFKSIYILLRKKPKTGLLTVERIRLYLEGDIEITDAQIQVSLFRLIEQKYTTPEGKGDKFDWLVTQMRLKIRRLPARDDAPLEERMKDFRAECDRFSEKYTSGFINNFFNYWAEYDTKTLTMRWETKDAFVVGMRMANYAKPTDFKRT